MQSIAANDSSVFISSWIEENKKDEVTPYIFTKSPARGTILYLRMFVNCLILTEDFSVAAFYYFQIFACEVQVECTIHFHWYC